MGTMLKFSVTSFNTTFQLVEDQLTINSSVNKNVEPAACFCWSRRLHRIIYFCIILHVWV